MIPSTEKKPIDLIPSLIYTLYIDTTERLSLIIFFKQTFEISRSTNWSSFSSLLKSVMECNSRTGSDEGDVNEVTASSATCERFLEKLC